VSQEVQLNPRLAQTKKDGFREDIVTVIPNYSMEPILGDVSVFELVGVPKTVEKAQSLEPLLSKEKEKITDYENRVPKAIRSQYTFAPLILDSVGRAGPGFKAFVMKIVYQAKSLGLMFKEQRFWAKVNAIIADNAYQATCTFYRLNSIGYDNLARQSRKAFTSVHVLAGDGIDPVVDPAAVAAEAAGVEE
jgi:hypothetical protein